MRRLPWLIMTAAICLLPASGWPAQQGQTSSAPSSKADASAATSSAAPAPQTDSLADAARKAQEKKKEAPKTAKVFTNDNLPKEGGISSVGQAAADKSSDSSASAPATAAATPASANDEKSWRDKFASLRKKLDQDQTELDVMQRELGVLSTQFYGGDPNAAFQDQQGQQVGGSAQARKIADIDAKKKQVASDQQAIDDAEDELRKAGGDAGWAR